ncbi:hypothetical protein [uncultured Selenomonas sp.]|uniref:hypothetical protein n=1 Tax=uncultured Selenomonas sp. TaxID=159275 RepID=UPI0025ECDA00|nr:hypothetical protein [uncultured Selenomonas sp.]
MKQDDAAWAKGRFLSILRECREQLVHETLASSPEVYRVLYDGLSSKKVEIWEKKHELEWFQLHLEKCQSCLDEASCTAARKRELWKLFLQLYQSFLQKWGYQKYDWWFLGKEVEGLKALLRTNSAWEQRIDEFKLDIRRQKKILDCMIEEES